ncbi:hypothetical protein NP233_g11775 [Leucocoprinus birnbaumii]|uniref:Uncharacterized protein n=1 Tax=Leucocoprinus birnbaumii TaxID=56174 RepID=A0AAD5VLK1_9AGAR|nr:hypothetical protein NP233_g11775 [Leucocoprinus birnbaumii]
MTTCTQQLERAGEIIQEFKKVDWDRNVSQMTAVREYNEEIATWEAHRRQWALEDERDGRSSRSREPSHSREPESGSRGRLPSRSQQDRSRSCSLPRRGLTRNLSPLSERRHGRREPARREQEMPQVPWELIKQYSAESRRAIASASEEVLWLLGNQAYRQLQDELDDLRNELAEVNGELTAARRKLQARPASNSDTSDPSSPSLPPAASSTAPLPSSDSGLKYTIKIYDGVEIFSIPNSAMEKQCPDGFPISGFWELSHWWATKKSTAQRPPNSTYMVFGDGTMVPKKRCDDIRELFRNSCNQAALVMPWRSVWSKNSKDFKDHVIVSVERIYPEIGNCSRHWKIKEMGTENFHNWAKGFCKNNDFKNLHPLDVAAMKKSLKQSSDVDEQPSNTGTTQDPPTQSAFASSLAHPSKSRKGRQTKTKNIFSVEDSTPSTSSATPIPDMPMQPVPLAPIAGPSLPPQLAPTATPFELSVIDPQLTGHQLVQVPSPMLEAPPPPELPSPPSAANHPPYSGAHGAFTFWRHYFGLATGPMLLSTGLANPPVLHSNLSPYSRPHHEIAQPLGAPAEPPTFPPPAPVTSAAPRLPLHSVFANSLLENTIVSSSEVPPGYDAALWAGATHSHKDQNRTYIPKKNDISPENLAGKHWVTEFGSTSNNKVKDFVNWWQNMSVADKTAWFEKSKALGFNTAPADSEEAPGKHSRGGSRKKKSMSFVPAGITLIVMFFRLIQVTHYLFNVFIALFFRHFLPVSLFCTWIVIAFMLGSSSLSCSDRFRYSDSNHYRFQTQIVIAFRLRSFLLLFALSHICSRRARPTFTLARFWTLAITVLLESPHSELGFILHHVFGLSLPRSLSTPSHAVPIISIITSSLI